MNMIMLIFFVLHTASAGSFIGKTTTTDQKGKLMELSTLIEPNKIEIEKLGKIVEKSEQDLDDLKLYRQS